METERQIMTDNFLALERNWTPAFLRIRSPTASSVGIPLLYKTVHRMENLIYCGVAIRRAAECVRGPIPDQPTRGYHDFAADPSKQRLTPNPIPLARRPVTKVTAG